MAAIDLTFLKPYMEKWVALAKDEKKVIAYGKTLKATIEKVQKEEYKDPIYTKVSPLESFIP